MNKLFLLLFLGFISFDSVAQEVEQCGHSLYMDYLDEVAPGIKNNIEQTFLESLRIGQLKNKHTQDTVYRVNVVFHIVSNNEAQNIDDSLIFSQLKVLNDAFRRTNADTINTREIFKPVAADAGIEFVMATEDPEGNPSNGIVRANTTLPTFGSRPTSLRRSDLVKTDQVGSAAWDTEKYLNIWVCDLSASGFDGLLGYAYPPTGADNWEGSNSFSTAENQGVVVHYKVVGVDNPESLATGSKTLVHEVGHYLGLRHIWGDGGCGVDDFMDDTPLARAASNGCNKGGNTCVETVGDQFPDMLENYMDYSNEVCQNLFTKDQVDQMRVNLTVFRSGIYEIVLPSVIFPEPVVYPASMLYPNPALDEVNVYLKNVDLSKNYEIAFFTTLGQKCKSFELVAAEFQTINGFSELSGMYLYRILSGEEVVLEGKIFFGM